MKKILDFFEKGNKIIGIDKNKADLEYLNTNSEMSNKEDTQNENRNHQRQCQKRQHLNRHSGFL